MREIMNIIREAAGDTFLDQDGKEIHIRPITSEEIEPMAARVIGYLYARCEQAKQKDDGSLMGACRTFWYGTMALEYLSVAVRSATSSSRYDDASGMHFSIATSNHVSQVAKMIERYVGINPMSDPKGWNP